MSTHALHGPPLRRTGRTTVMWQMLGLLVFLLLLSGQAMAQISYTVGQYGIDTLNYNGWQYIQGYSGPSRFGGYGFTCNFQRSDGTTYSYTQDATTRTVNGNTVTNSYPWGNAIITFTQDPNNSSNLDMQCTLQNTTGDTLTEGYSEALSFQWPIATPDAYDARFGHLILQNQPRYISTADGPGAIMINLTTYGVLTICDDTDPTIQDYTGGLCGGDYLEVHFEAPILAGQSGTQNVSLRFSPANADPSILTLAGDIYQRFDAAYPLMWNWPNRSMVGCDFLSSAPPHPSNGLNPRGWFNNDDTIDVTTQTGLANFQSRMLSRVQSEISVMQQYNIQGVIIWDIEGQEMYQPISYVGSPDKVFNIAPEMAYMGTHNLCVADEIFQDFRNAGFKVGVCLRPQDYEGTDENYYQMLPANPTQELLNKIAYAYNRWGCTMFYIDSTVTGQYGSGGNSLNCEPLLSTIMQQYPDILIAPENQTAKYYAYCPPYDQLNYDPPGTSAHPQIVEEWNGAATMLKMYNYTSSNYAGVMASIQSGDILIGNSWYADPDMVAGATLLTDMGARPTVSITSPAPGTQVLDTQPLQIDATAACTGKTLQEVDFYAGPIEIGTATTAPYTYSWSGYAANTSYNLYAKAITTDGCSAVSTPVKVSIVTGNNCVAPTFSLRSGLYIGAYSVSISTDHRGGDDSVYHRWHHAE